METMGNVLILSADKQVTSQLCTLVSEERFEAKVFRNFDELESALSKAQGQVAILDVDSVSIDNRKIKLLKKSLLADLLAERAFKG